MDIRNLVDQFCDYSIFIRGYSPDTIKRYRFAVAHFQRSTDISRIEECSEERVRGFLYRGRAERHWAANSYITYHKSLLVFFRWCVDQGHLTRNPADGIELPKVAKALPSKLSRQQALRLLEIVQNYPYPYTFLRYRNHAILATFLHAGLRKKELLHLQMVDVDVANQSIFVRRGKGNKDRIVPMSSTLAGILSRYLEERGRLRKTCPGFFASLNRNEGFTDEGLKRLVQFARHVTRSHFTIHSLRHTFATLMLEGGCDLFSLSKMMGHSDIKTTTIYLAASAEHLRSQMVKHPLNSA